MSKIVVFEDGSKQDLYDAVSYQVETTDYESRRMETHIVRLTMMLAEKGILTNNDLERLLNVDMVVDVED